MLAYTEAAWSLLLGTGCRCFYCRDAHGDDSSNGNHPFDDGWCAQFFDAAQPDKEDKPEAAAGADLGALLAAEVQDLKSNQSRLFSYVKTNVNGLLYLQMQRDVGALQWHPLLHPAAWHGMVPVS